MLVFSSHQYARAFAFSQVDNTLVTVPTRLPTDGVAIFAVFHALQYLLADLSSLYRYFLSSGHKRPMRLPFTSTRTITVSMDASKKAH